MQQFHRGAFTVRIGRPWKTNTVIDLVRQFFFEGMDPDGEMGPFVTPDDQLSARVDGTAYTAKKMAALACHRTQIQEDGFFFQGAESGHAFWGDEFYRLAKGVPGPVGKDGLEADLFAGLD